ncbi:putative RNA-directed DNA polymerase from mobile element jockey-like [Apostichopus japonicus]|uniref:Putative RNA-directed DNA polymerase from mobile element jockey-like n=1 Tax=Stichopus japonicus TaxID=307972 RepID=A0A2G8KPM3_STIJA|nr:putative RNA-directed DNA polymerase from mobile element jockey-like [Apostichopus japonicus]
MEDVTSSLNRQRSVDVVFLDFQKAFDKVPHQRLLLRLKSMGVIGNLLSWIGNWLGNREQRVVINGCASSWQNVTSGVPQGSVLGPLLFVAYINDIDGDILCTAKKFADDTKLYSEVSSKSDSEKFQADLDKIFSWSQGWQMLFNIDKCKVMHIGSSNQKFTYNLNGVELQEVSVERDLGIYIDSSLQPSKHCLEAAKRGNRVLGMIKRNFSFLKEDIVVRLYKQLVRPHLEYAVQAWNPYFAKDKEVLEKVQRRATRMISSLKRVPYYRRLQLLNLTTLELRRLRGDLIQVFKIVYGFDNLSFTDFFMFAKLVCTRGHCLKLQKSHSRINIRHNFFSNRVVNEWNSLPEKVVLASSVNGFKNALDKHFKHCNRV